MPVRSHQDLEVRQMAMELAKAVYRQTAQFPKEELYGLAAQLRRSAVSVPSNIAEGAARHSRQDFKRFLAIALGSLTELETQWILAQGLGFIPEGEASVLAWVKQIRLMLLGLIRKLSRWT